MQLFVKNYEIWIYCREIKRNLGLYLSYLFYTCKSVWKLPHQPIETWSQFTAKQNIVENQYCKSK